MGKNTTKVQLFFEDSHAFEFKRRLLETSCLLTKHNDIPTSAWGHTYSGEYDFIGYKNISAGKVTLGFPRDIFLDPHNKAPIAEASRDSNKPIVNMSYGKPSSAKGGLKIWVSEVAEKRRHFYRGQAQPNTTMDYIQWLLCGVIVLMIVGWCIRFATAG